MLHEDVDIDFLSKITNGYTGSDIKNLCLAAAMAAVKDHIKIENAKIDSKNINSLNETSNTATTEATTETTATAETTGTGTSTAETVSMIDEPTERINKITKQPVQSVVMIRQSHLMQGKKEIKKSVHEDAENVKQLREWDSMYGLSSKKNKKSLGFHSNRKDEDDDDHIINTAIKEKEKVAATATATATTKSIPKFV